MTVPTLEFQGQHDRHVACRSNQYESCKPSLKIHWFWTSGLVGPISNLLFFSCVFMILYTFIFWVFVIFSVFNVIIYRMFIMNRRWFLDESRWSSFTKGHAFDSVFSWATPVDWCCRWPPAGSEEPASAAMSACDHKLRHVKKKRSSHILVISDLSSRKKSANKTLLVAGWKTNPSEKYAQVKLDRFPQGSGWT